MRSDPNLITTKVDKGGQNFIFEKFTYLGKYHKLINDYPYVDIHKDPSTCEIDTIKSAIKTSPSVSAKFKKSLIPLIAHFIRFNALPYVP